MIEARKLTRRFGQFTAVKEVEFSIPKGQVIGFLGPNGAGKTTTMKMLTGYLEPSAGTAIIGGHDIRKDPVAVKRMIGYLPESAPLYSEMTVEEFLSFIADVRQVGGSAKKTAMSKMRTVCELQNVWQKSIETLSKGYRQRVGLAAALIQDPQILILDEPTDGLDPNQKFYVRRLIKELGQDKTIILSTHILEEVEAMCERVLIIAQGELVADAAPAELMRQSDFHNVVTIKVNDVDVSSVANEIRNWADVAKVEVLDSGLRIFPKERKSIIDAVSRYSKESRLTFSELHVDEGRLDDVFRRVTRSSTAEAANHSSNLH